MITKERFYEIAREEGLREDELDNYWGYEQEAIEIIGDVEYDETEGIRESFQALRAKYPEDFL